MDSNMNNEVNLSSSLSSLSCLLNSFRDDGCSQLSSFIHDANNTTNVISDAMMSQDDGVKQKEEIGSMTWICANDLGKVMSININSHDNNMNFNESRHHATDSQITAIAASPGGKQVALAFDDMLHLRKFPNVEDEVEFNNDNESVSMQMLCRRTLPITHIEYDNHGKM